MHLRLFTFNTRKWKRLNWTRCDMSL